jgi:putative ABC transport system permease protein
MLAIDKKLWRELWELRMQALAIAMVIVGGVSIFIMSLSTLDSLYETRAAYYREHHFADVFANLKRAPLALLQRIENIPGVDKVESRVVAYVSVDVPGFEDPVSGHLLSLPDNSRGLLNQIYIRKGRLFEPGRDNEVLLSIEFASAHKLEPGDKLHATINGRRKTLTIVGLTMSPEYIYQIAPGALFPDYKRYGVMWMARKPLATAYDMDGAFNNVTLTLSKDTREQKVIDQLDQLLKPYGGTGAIAQEEQLSNRFLSEELKQQETVATIFPVIFFGVAAFLLNVVISRLVSLQREQIAGLKAFGYSNFAVGLHYIKLVILIVGFGVMIGIAAGIWMGQGLSNIYMTFFSLPFMLYTLKPGVIIAAVLISMGVAILGTLHAVRNAAKLPPAQAMRPEPPSIYHATIIERLGLQRWFTQPTRMIFRHIERHPLKALLTMLGLAMSCGVMVVSGFQEGAIDHMIEVQYGLSQREDMMITYTEPTSQRSMYSLRDVQGIEHVEGFRDVPARLRFEHRSYLTSVTGIQPEGKLMRLLDSELKEITVPPHGIVLTDYLAQILRIQPGDLLTIEVLEGQRPIVQVPVAGTAKQDMGMNAYLQRSTLNRLLKEGDTISGAFLKVDERDQRNVYRELKDMPRIAGVIEKESAIEAFYENVAQTILFYTFVTTLLGGSIAFGVVYNSMRIALSERSRELASLRVLGFERAEVAYILLGEMGVLTLVAIPVGLLFGFGLCAYMAYAFDTDLYRVPLVLGLHVYAFAALVVIVSAVLSALLIWRNISQLDMVAVLKTKE